jgi:polyhydroxybutyrate depolymerase
MKTRSTALLALSLLLNACASASPAAGPFAPHQGTEGEGILGSWVHSGGYQRDYILATPESMDSEDAYPMIIFMHGAGGTAVGLHSWISPDSATAEAGFVAVYPEGLDKSWDVGCGPCTSAGMQGVDDLLFINTLVRHLSDSLPIDPSQVYLAGHSLGAQFVHYYACESSTPPAGIAALSGLWLRRTAVRCPADRDIPVLMIHGDKDRILPWEGPPQNISALSMPEAWERWYELLDCRATPTVVEGNDLAGDGTSVQSTTVEGCRGDTSIELYRLRGAGHGWPGRARAAPALGPHTGNLDGLTEILRFFSAQAARSGSVSP